jgi:hypothetical protein
MVQLKASDEYSSASKDVVASVDLNGALAFVTTLPSPHTFRTEGYVSRQSLSLLSGRPLSKLPELPVKKRKGRLGDRLNAFRLGLERQVHGIQHSAAETLQNVQNAAKELFVDLGLVEKERIVRAEDEAPEWYEDEIYQVSERMSLENLLLQLLLVRNWHSPSSPLKPSPEQLPALCTRQWPSSVACKLRNGKRRYTS